MSTPSTKQHPPGVIATLTALGLNGRCLDEVPHVAFLEDVWSELSTLRERLQNDEKVTTDDALRVVRTLCHHVGAFLSLAPEIDAYGRELYQGGPSARAANDDAPRSTPTTAPSDGDEDSLHDLHFVAQDGAATLADVVVRLQRFEEDMIRAVPSLERLATSHAKGVRERVVNAMDALQGLSAALIVRAVDEQSEAEAAEETEAAASLASKGLGVSFAKPSKPVTRIPDIEEAPTP